MQTAASGTSIQIPIDGDGGHLLQVFAGSKQGLLFVAIDGTGPEVQAVAQPDEGFGAKTITITAVDKFGSGVALIEYSLDGGSWIQYTAPFEQSSSATIQYRAFDFVGNGSPTGTLEVVVDVDAPIVTATLINGVLGSNGWYTSGDSIELTAQDAGSGVASIEYSLDGTDFGPYTGPIPATEGETIVYFRATDVAGNTSDVDSEAFRIDSIAPTITVFVEGGYNGPSTVTLEGLDTGSGIASISYKVDGVPTVYTGPFEIPAGATNLVVYATDVAGNQSTQVAVPYSVCLLYDPLREQPNTGTVPVKVQLCDANRKNLSTRNLTLTAFSVDGVNSPSPNDTGSSNDGFDFRYDRKLAGYIYNLNVDKLTNNGGEPVQLQPGYHTLDFIVKGHGSVVYSAGFTLK